MTKTTRTLNPLHFEDLESHRFEDLIRQLIYDLRDWVSIEAIGRSGSDEGIDIRATEEIASRTYDPIEEDSDNEPARDYAPIRRTWIIQCKREKRLPPSKVRKIVEDFLAPLEEKPYGYILAAACDFSKAARDAFRAAMVEYGVQEFIMWGKAELEDRLFLPQNDHLLFAYFGISLQIRRRSMRTEVRRILTLKRKLIKELGSIKSPNFEPVLIRDPRDENYPFIESVEEFLKNPSWGYYKLEEHEPVNHLSFVARECFAFLDIETEEWDVLLDYNDLPDHPQLYGLSDEHYINDKRRRYHSYWLNEIPAKNRARFKEIAIIPYERILAVDEMGDFYNEGPHLLVEYRHNGDPFEPNGFFWVESVEEQDFGIVPDEGKRIEYFPKIIPEPKPREKETPTETS